MNVRCPRLLVVALLWIPLTASAADAPFIHCWLVCGPFECADEPSRLSRDHLLGEADVAPDAGLYSVGRPWVERRHEGDRLNLQEARPGVPPRENAAAYAHVYVHAPEEQDAAVLVGSDDGVAVWVNGARVLFRDVTRACRQDEDRAPTRLRKGWNRLLFKISQGSGPWELCARIAGPDGQSVPGLAFSAANPDPAAFPAPKTEPRIVADRVGARPAPEPEPRDLLKAEGLMAEAETFAAWARFIEPSLPDLAAASRFAKGGGKLEWSLQTIAARVNTLGEGAPVLVFNPLSWERDDLAEAEAPWEGGEIRVVDAATEREVPSQVIARGVKRATVLFRAAGVPSIGYRLFFVQAGDPAPPAGGAASADETADRGQTQHFTPGLYPQRVAGRESGTLRRAREFNHPLLARAVTPHAGTLPVTGSFLRIEPDNVVLEAVKHAEDGGGPALSERGGLPAGAGSAKAGAGRVEGLIVRFYETHGRASQASIALPAVPKEAIETDPNERPIGEAIRTEGAWVRVPIKPYEIKTLRVRF